MNESIKQLNEEESQKLEYFKLTHKCPWYIRLFKRTPKFEIKQEHTCIGIGTSVKCTRCGEEYDITDYGEW